MKFELSVHQIAQSIPAMTENEKAMLRSMLAVDTDPLRMALTPEAIKYAGEGMSLLTARERQVVQKIVSFGQSNKNVARELQISPRTVEVHRAAAMRKLGARNVVELCHLVMAVSNDS